MDAANATLITRALPARHVSPLHLISSSSSFFGFFFFFFLEVFCVSTFLLVDLINLDREQEFLSGSLCLANRVIQFDGNHHRRDYPVGSPVAMTSKRIQLSQLTSSAPVPTVYRLVVYWIII